MSVPEGCPCEAVKDIKILVERHERQLNEGNVNFALIKQDLDYIKGRLDEKKRFGSGIAASIIAAAVSGVVMLILGFVAAKIGMV